MADCFAAFIDGHNAFIDGHTGSSFQPCARQPVADCFAAFIDGHASPPDASSIEVIVADAMPVRRLGWSHYAFAAASAALVALALVWWTTPVPAAPSRPVATLVLSDRCDWRGPALVPGQRLMTGTVRLKSGTALVRFDGGSEVLLSGATELALESPASAALHVGQATVRADGDAAGFVLPTPVSEVTDLGTEFALSVDRSGVTDLQVLDGTVAWRALAAPGADADTVLSQGQAVRLRSARRRPCRGWRWPKGRHQETKRADEDHPSARHLVW